MSIAYLRVQMECLAIGWPGLPANPIERKRPILLISQSSGGGSVFCEGEGRPVTQATLGE